ncbi:MAG TPA: Verru/Chthon cassette protein A, partial [Prosthecobacter sp.]
YIDRTTGLRALLRSERVLAIQTAAANVYKSSTVSTNYRQEIDADETLKQFKTRFDSGDIFRSPSEICGLYLVPQGESLANMSSFWETNKLTADNSREHPYATLYPRLTTKSNTYRIHYRVQALQQASRSRGSDEVAWAMWEEGRDRVVAENRGSSVLERYVDPADPALPDFAKTSGTLDSHYRFRIISNTKFGPK